ncbi:YwiC-like family protein [Paenibacillus sp. OSY-SE]|uniref:YwiC-like family protein n=1 Tax=Paenibacillus sp. OSY-SE TaxID=1196323 RepID=UPI0012FAAC1E|nr:YwiC-like family protein [Paenibacillus sp. OSY-SE]
MSTVSADSRSRRLKRVRSYIPNQHGAWAMLIVPFVVGMFASRPNMTHVWLFVAWLAVYCGSFACMQWIKTRRITVYLGPMLVYGVTFVVSAVVVVALRPDIWWMGAVMLPLFVVNLMFAKQKNERHLVNDFVAVLQFCWMLIISFEIGGGTDWSLAWRLFAACVLYFVGTVFYVKTMIREKGNPVYYALSIIVHLIAASIVGLLFPAWIAVPFALLFIRAVWMPKQAVTVKQVGISEIGFSAVTACSLIALL